MKKRLKIENLKGVLTVLLLMVFSVSGYAQACSGNQITLTIKNMVATSTTLEYDVWMMNTGSTTMKVAGFAGNVRFPVGIMPSGVGQLTIVDQPATTGNWPGMSGMAPALVNTGTLPGQARWTNTPFLPETGAIILESNVDKKWGRFRITNNGTPWSNVPCQLTFNTAINPGGATLNTVTVYCEGNPNSTPVSLAASNSLVLVNPASIILGQTTCFTSGSYAEIPASCSNETDGEATFTMSPVPSDLSASYILDSNPSVAVTLSATGTFTISGLSAGAHTLSVTGATGCTTPVSVPFTITAPTPVTPTFTQVPSICTGGTLNALPTTSNNGVLGTWAPALDNANTTTYTFTPEPGECATTATMTITVNALTVPTFTQVGPICTGDTLSPLPTTSNNSITGTWAPALDNMNTTTYTFTPTAGQCADTATMTITVNSGSSVVPTFTQVGPICAGAALSALPTTSNNGITGTWAPALDNMNTTTYTFTPAAGQCAATATMTITVDAAPVTTDYAVCQGGTVTGGLTSTLSGGSITPLPNYSGNTTGGLTFTRPQNMAQGGTCANSAVGVGVRYTTHTFVAPATGAYGFSTCGNAAFDTVLALYQDPFNPAGLCAGNSLVACSDDNCGGAAQSNVTANLVQGTSYTLVVTGFDPAVDFGAYTVVSTTPTSGGGSVEWYTGPVGGSAIGTGSPFNPVGVSGSGIADTNTAGATPFYAQFPGSTCRTLATFTVSANVTPTFTQVAAVCAGTTLSALPTTSNNGITGTWAPALDNMNTATYTFTPAAGQCATTATMTITVNPATNTTTTVTACSSYTWPVNGTTYTTSGIYVVPVVLQSGIFNTLATWNATATANGATVASNPLTGMTVTGGAINVTIGGVAVNMTSTLGGMYAAPTFVGTNNANQPLTMTFSPPAYGVSGNYYVTNSADAVIAGTLTVTYSDGTVDTQPVTSNNDFFGYFKDTGISSIVMIPVITTPNVNRFASLRNLNVATVPACQTQTLDLTINTPVTPTFTQVAAICAGATLSALPTTSNNGITGTWAPALDNMNTATYTFTPDVGQCANTATMTITVNPIVNTTSTVAACDSYTWAVNGTTYTTSGIYVVPVVLQSGIFNTLATWNATATANGATVASNPLTGMTVTGGAINVNIGGVAVNMTSTLGGMYAAPTFVGTNNANQPLTMTFNPPAYGVSGNYYVTNSADAVIAGTLTVTYSDGTVDTQPVTSNNDFFGYFKDTGISSIVMIPVITTPNVNRFASLRNLNVATVPPCQTRTLDLTITPSVTPTFTQVAAICAGTTLSALPTTSNNGVTGTWAPALDNMNTTTYTFTPAVGQCAPTATMTITVNPTTNVTTTVAACGSYTWAANGTTYTTSGIYVIPHVLQSGIFNTLATWNATATANGATVASNPLTGMTVTGGAINVNIGGVAVNMTSTLGGMYAAPTFVGTNNANQPLTMTFNPPAYGVSGNYYVTNSADAVIAGTLTVTYSDGTVDTQPVTSNNDFFGYFKDTGISSIVMIPVITTPNVNRFASLRNLNVATAPACQTRTLDLTINTPAATPTGSSTQSFSVVALNDATIASLVVSPSGVIWYGSLLDAQNGTNPLASTTVLTNGATYWAVNPGTPCPSAPFAVTVTVVLGNDDFNNMNFTFYPNPTSSVLNISYSKEISEIQVTNLLGQVIMTRKTNSTDVQVDLSSLAAAAYFVKVTSEGNSKIVKVIRKD